MALNLHCQENKFFPTLSEVKEQLDVVESREEDKRRAAARAQHPGEMAGLTKPVYEVVNDRNEFNLWMTAYDHGVDWWQWKDNNADGLDHKEQRKKLLATIENMRGRGYNV